MTAKDGTMRMTGKGILSRTAISAVAAILLSASPGNAQDVGLGQGLNAVLRTLMQATNQGPIQVCFTPHLLGACDPQTAVIEAIDSAQKSILVQMFTLTDRAIVEGLLSAKRRGSTCG